MNKTKRYCVSNIDRPGIYILFDDEQAVYVGQSLLPYERIGVHIRQKKMIFNSFRILKCSKEKLNYWESYLIYNLYPRYNVKGKDGKSLDKLRKKAYKTSNNHKRKKPIFLTTSDNVQISFGNETSCHVEEYARSLGYNSWDQYVIDNKNLFQTSRVNPDVAEAFREARKYKQLLSMTKQSS